MAFTRASARKIAADRANAQKSTGPRTAEGKARSSRNGCVYYYSARRRSMPESWEKALYQEALHLTEHTTDPVRRALETDVDFHFLWSTRVLQQEDRPIENCIRRHPGDPKREANLFLSDPPCTFRRLTLRVDRRPARAVSTLYAYLKPPLPRGRRATARTEKAPPKRFDIVDALATLMKIGRAKPEPKQNKQPSIFLTPRPTTAALSRDRQRAVPTPPPPPHALIRIINQTQKCPMPQHQGRNGLRHHPPVNVLRFQPNPPFTIQPVPPRRRPQTRQARPHSQPPPLRRSYFATSSSTAGRGPTIAISPLSTFQSCGNSFSENRRSHRRGPTIGALSPLGQAKPTKSVSENRHYEHKTNGSTPPDESLGAREPRTGRPAMYPVSNPPAKSVPKADINLQTGCNHTSVVLLYLCNRDGQPPGRQQAKRNACANRTNLLV